jgi:glycosyltransferase involved in cell wall biosynthesis
MTVGIVRVSSGASRGESREIVHEVVTSADDTGDKAAALALNKFDVAVVQYGQGVYGGSHGDQVLRIMNWIRVPTVVVAHSIPAGPDDPEFQVLRQLVDSADAVVTMSESGRQRLVSHYSLSARKVIVIQHGAEKNTAVRTTETWPAAQPTILTWGLLGPGKGIEWGIEALPALRKLKPPPRYVVAGQTHPGLSAGDAVAYRAGLTAQAARLGVADLVHFDPRHLPAAELAQLVADADIILLPFDAPEQVTSAVLVEAIAARVPIVATSFPHAQEVLSGDHGGLVVPARDPGAIAKAVSRLLTQRTLAEKVIAQSAGYRAILPWPLVAVQHRQLFDALLRRPTGR